ncbi:unnamed protein product [Urochloa decumbens]|uniref:DUF1618 domain-containing protein n=1 Tax=Urochloa decumbens TaxID=240449 RepID=A0ABC9AN56_9POAL
MKLLLRHFGGLSLSDAMTLFNRARSTPCRGLPSLLQSRRRSSVDPVPVPRRRQMQTLIDAVASEPTGPSPPVDPRWVLLNHWIVPRDSANVVADDKTAAECRPSCSRPLRISLGDAAPPAISFLCLDLAGDRRARSEDDEFTDKHVLGYIGDDDDFTGRNFDHCDTGILRHSDDELLVAQLRVANDAPFDTAQLCVLRPGRLEWELNTAVPIVHTNGGRGHDLQMWQEAHVAVPVGDRFLCWVNFDCSTFLLCDMATRDPKLHYVPLPVKAMPPKDDEDYEDCYDEQPPWLYYRRIGAAGPDAVRFVSIDNRCCCGAHVIWSSCEHSSSAFMVTMWTLALSTSEPMRWVKEAVLDCEVVWSLATSKGLPRVRLTSPVVSMENPDVVCFMASMGDLLWTVDIDLRKKTLISATPCPAHPVECVNYANPLPAKLHSP